MAINGIELVSVPVADQERAKGFYTDKLGFNVLTDAEFDEGRLRWVQLAPPGAGPSITLITWNDQMRPGTLQELYLQCEDIDRTYDDLSSAGVSFSQPVFDTPYGRFARFTDPDGNGWSLHEPGE